MNDNCPGSLLSVVIICCDDERVFQAIDSVDPGISVIVSLVPNDSLEERLQETRVQVVLSQRGNYSTSCNRGLTAVKTKYAFIMDSDCVLQPGCLTEITKLLALAPLARARLDFEFQADRFMSKKIAEWHFKTNNRLPIRAYTPGLGLRVDIRPVIGDFFFDERIFWSGDSEFHYRVKKAGLTIEYAECAALTHGPISFRHFLKSGFKLGMGTRAQVKLGLRLGYESPNWIVRRFLFRINPSRKKNHLQTSEQAKQDWFLTTVWTISFYLGYYSVFYKPVHQIRM